MATLRPHERKRTSKTIIAMRLIEAAAARERDPGRAAQGGAQQAWLHRRREPATPRGSVR